MSGGLVIFEAGARTAWQIYPLGQTLIFTAGAGRVQQSGGPVQEDPAWRRIVHPARREALAQALAHRRDKLHRSVGGGG